MLGIYVLPLSLCISHNWAVPRAEYDKLPKVYAEVPQDLKDKLDDIRAYIGAKHEREALIEAVEDYHKRHNVPPNKRRKKS